MAGYLRWRAGAWRLRVDAGTDPLTGKRRQVHRTVHAPNNRTGRKTAEQELAKLVTEVAAGRTAPTSDMTVAELLERYIALKATSWAPGSDDATRARVTRHVTPRIGNVPVERLRPADLDHLYATLLAGGLSAASIRRVHNVIRAAFAQAIRWDLIASNPASRATPPREPRRDVTPPAPEQVVALLDAAAGDDPTLGLFVRLAAVTGARRGQLCALRWSDVDLDAAEVRFTRALAKVRGGAVAKDTKTGARWAVAIDPATVRQLRDHRRRQAETALSVGVPLAPDACLFAQDAAGTRPWHPDGASQRFARLRARVGLDGVRLHDLRHYMATQLLAEGFDVATVTGRGGWATATTPLRVYAHFQPARDRAAAERLGQVLDESG